MTKDELSSYTVLELRKIAKEYHVKLSAGIDKAGIIQRIGDAMDAQSAAQSTPAPEPAPAPAAVPQAQPAPAAPVRAAAPVRTEEKPRPAIQYQTQGSWHSPAQDSQPRYSSKGAYQAPAYAARPAYQAQPRPAQNRFSGPASSADTNRIQTPRPATVPNRWGPGAAETPVRPERPVQPKGFGPAAQQSAPAQPERQNSWAPVQNNDFSTAQPTREELLTMIDFVDGAGILELHPEGYGFLRQDSLLPSNRDIYVSMAQVRRFSLRSGDKVSGKIRPKRDSDKYAAMLYITSVNDREPDTLVNRAAFDDLTPVYPDRRIDLDCHDGQKLDDMRLTDLLSPIGFGQRAMVLCPPDTGKTQLLQHFGSVIKDNYPEARVLALLIDETPEEATVFRENAHCTVIASTFDQMPENHLRLVDMVLERAERFVEQGEDVVILVDSLTKISKIYTTAAVQQGRSIPGMVNPTSLLRAKKLFGAARCIREGGSLTVIGCLDIETGNRVDDTIVEEFKGTANMELVLSSALALRGVQPPFDLARCRTKNADLLLDEDQKQGLALTRSVLGSTPNEAAIPQLLQMMDKTQSNAQFLERIKDWAALLAKK